MRGPDRGTSCPRLRCRRMEPTSNASLDCRTPLPAFGFCPSKSPPSSSSAHHLGVGDHSIEREHFPAHVVACVVGEEALRRSRYAGGRIPGHRPAALSPRTLSALAIWASVAPRRSGFHAFAFAFSQASIRSHASSTVLAASAWAASSPSSSPADRSDLGNRLVAEEFGDLERRFADQLLVVVAVVRTLGPADGQRRPRPRGGPGPPGPGPGCP